MVNHHPPLVIKFIIVTCDSAALLLLLPFTVVPTFAAEHRIAWGDIKQYNITTTTLVAGATVEGGRMEMEKSVRVGWWVVGAITGPVCSTL